MSVLPCIWTFRSLGTAAFTATKELLALEIEDANDAWYCDNNWHKKKDEYDDAPQPCIAGFLRCFSVVIELGFDRSRRHRCFLYLSALMRSETRSAVLTDHESFIINRFGRIDISRSAVRATRSGLVESI